MTNTSDRESDGQTDSFRRRHYPDVSEADWNDWKWQIKNRVTTYEALEGLLSLTEAERGAADVGGRSLPFTITPYYASLLDADDPGQPLRRAVVPNCLEAVLSPGERQDPLGEEDYRPAPCIIHRYEDRVLFLATDFCSVRCRYCTRSRLVSQDCGGRGIFAHWEQGLRYIAEHPAIRDVLISGGDPLTLPDEQLEWLLARLRAIGHVEFIRIGTKVPAVLPQRITSALLEMLKKYHPLWMSIHFIHPDELTRETRLACCALADAGIPLGSQTVLLRGVNDNVETLMALYHGLLKIRVRPYYLYQCDPIAGSAHFRTTVEKGIEIINDLAGRTTGYAVPSYVVDTPQGGKIRLLPDYFTARSEAEISLRGYNGASFSYPNPVHAGREG